MQTHGRSLRGAALGGHAVAQHEAQLDAYQGAKGLAFEEVRLWFKAKSSDASLQQVVAETAERRKANP